MFYLDVVLVVVDWPDLSDFHSVVFAMNDA
jgi:hypothetical protein